MRYSYSLLLLLVVACAPRKLSPVTINQSMYDSPLIDRETALYDPYDLSLDIQKKGSDHYSIVSIIELHGGSFYVSPLSSNDFKGRFTISIEDDSKLSITDKFKETPRSKEVYDPHQFVNGLVNWVQEDTKYNHEVMLNTKKDFDVLGEVVFTIEPRCSLEKIPFVIKNRSGVLSISKLVS